MTAPLLEVRDLHVGFGATQAVRGIDFTVEPGETLAIVGESGSGKSATALAILRLIEREGGRIEGGQILLSGEDGVRVDLATLPEARMQRLRGAVVSMIFQEPMTSLNPVLTIGDQISEVFVRHRAASPREGLVAARDALARVRVSDPQRLSQYPHELSGGMRQRVMIAMALACRPKLLIADEPTTALDVTTQAEILALVRELQAEIGMAVLFITHDMGVVAHMADRVLVLKDGLAVEEAGVEDVFARPRAAYTRLLVEAAPRLGAGSPQDLPPSAPSDETRAAPVLFVEGLNVRFPVRRGLFGRALAEIHAVEDVGFTLDRGETLGLVGESGYGKSTLARAVLGLVPIDSGGVLVAGHEVARLSRRKFLPMRREAQMIFQDPFASLNPRLPVWDLVTEPAQIHGLAAGDARRTLAEALLRKVDLTVDCLDRYPHQFSGGQRQRLCIARALSVSPSLLVADEPVSALDVSIARHVTDLLADLQAREGLSFLFISHDIAVVKRLSHRIAVMYAGQIVEIGPARAVLDQPAHPYTRRLLAAALRPDPSARRDVPSGRIEEPPSPVRAPDARTPASRLVEHAPGHYARDAA